MQSMHKRIIQGILGLAVAAGGLAAGSGAAWASPANATQHAGRNAIQHAGRRAALPAVYLAKSKLTFEDVVINPQSTMAYFTVAAKNEVALLDLATGTYGKPIPVGSDPLGLDITPNGKTLYVCDAGGQTISVVDLATRKVTTITTPAGTSSDTPYSIAVMNNGHALYTTTFAGSGFGANAYNLNLSTGTSTVVTSMGFGGEVTEVTPLSRSSSYSTVGAVLGDDSGGPFDIYTASTGAVVSGSLNSFISTSSLDGNGGTMLVDGSYVIDGSTGSLLGTISDSCGSSALNDSGSTGYCLAQDSILKLNIKRFLTEKPIPLSVPAGGGAQLALSKNGKILVAETQSGAEVVTL
jgi:YVTN family beta-propeller protein